MVESRLCVVVDCASLVNHARGREHDGETLLGLKGSSRLSDAPKRQCYQSECKCSPWRLCAQNSREQPNTITDITKRHRYGSFEQNVTHGLDSGANNDLILFT
jgi:hypothetical protein